MTNSTNVQFVATVEECSKIDYCPHCGSEALLNRILKDNACMVFCVNGNCGAQVWRKATAKETIDAWNRRFLDD